MRQNVSLEPSYLPCNVTIGESHFVVPWRKSRNNTLCDDLLDPDYDDNKMRRIPEPLIVHMEVPEPLILPMEVPEAHFFHRISVPGELSLIALDPPALSFYHYRVDGAYTVMTEKLPGIPLLVVGDAEAERITEDQYKIRGIRQVKRRMPLCRRGGK